MLSLFWEEKDFGIERRTCQRDWPKDLSETKKKLQILDLQNWKYDFYYSQLKKSVICRPQITETWKLESHRDVIDVQCLHKYIYANKIIL